jgi:hypothetical protein
MEFIRRTKTEQKKINESILMGNFGLGMQVYGSDLAYTNNYWLEGNVFFPVRFIYGGYNLATNLTITNNYTYQSSFDVSYDNPWNDVKVTNNYFGSSFQIARSKGVVFSGNTSYNPTGTSIGRRMDYPLAPGNVISDYTFSNNTYYSTRPKFDVSFYSAPNQYAFDRITDSDNFSYYHQTWQDLGYDQNSTFTRAVAPDRVFVRRNAYDSSRAHVIIYNWSNTPNVDIVDNTGLLQNGDPYELRNALDLYGDVITGTYNGKITVNMTTRKSAVLPVGWNKQLTPNTFPTFGAFVLINLRTGTPLVGNVGANKPPTVNAGPDRKIPFEPTIMQGSISDDTTQNPAAFWIKQSGPGNVTFTDYKNPQTGVSFSAEGKYVLRLVGTDGQLGSDDFVILTVGNVPDAPGTPDNPGAPSNQNINFQFNPVIDPSHPRMDIQFTMISAGAVTFKIYDRRTGTLVRDLFNGSLASGAHTISWDGTNSQGARLASGTYLLKISVDGTTQTRTLAVIR